MALLTRKHAAGPALWLACILLAGCMDAVGDQQKESPNRHAALVAPVKADVVVAWNELGYRIAYAEDQFLTFKGQRALAMMNLAMHDALNAVAPKFERYALRGSWPRTDPELAAARAASGVLRAVYPAQSMKLDSLLGAQAERVAEQQRASAAALGGAAAEAVLTARGDDGWAEPGSYAFVQGPGNYQTTPDWQGFVLQPGFRNARPFALRTPSAFRPPRPPPLQSAVYARAYEEVRRHGAARSADRTADQAAYAIWWLEFAEGSVNRLTRRLVAEKSVDLWSAARLFAQLHVSLYDGYIATWDAKYEYNHWRPFTAIRAAGDDGNRSTQPAADWQSLLPAPPFPEYVSAHATGCAAAFAVLASVFADETAFTMTTSTAPPAMPQRSFPSFTAAANECADSRVRLGWHFRYSTDAGLALGRRVARHVLQTQLRALD